MVEMRMVISHKGVSRQFALKEEQVLKLKGVKLGQKIKGDDFGLEGYELELRGGSDKDGFPMRQDVHGAVRKGVILSTPPGYHPKNEGVRKRKLIKGGTIDTDIAQLNTVVVKEGKRKLEEIFPAKEKKEEK
jgi:small subunit ribosomal protein S6e